MLLRIDSRDRVTTVDDEWAKFARESGADPLFPGAEVGKPYRDCIRNAQVAEVYRVFIERIRRGRGVIRIPVRGDTARERRFFVLEMSADESGTVELRLTSKGTEPRSPGDWSPPPTEDETIRMCSFCRRVQWDLEWMELEEAVKAGDLFGASKFWQISHGSCPSCLKERLCEIEDE